jgi:hypothetical protein
MVCVLSPAELADLESGVQPNCRCHTHISRRKADELNELVLNTPQRKEREAAYVGKGKRFIVFQRSRSWMPKMSGGALDL